jgi:hypothetical protein
LSIVYIKILKSVALSIKEGTVIKSIALEGSVQALLSAGHDNVLNSATPFKISPVHTAIEILS